MNSKTLLCICLFWLLVRPSSAQPLTKADLLAMQKADQALRMEIISTSNGLQHIDSALLARMRVEDSLRSSRLKQSVAEFGWPQKDDVGKRGIEAAFILLQHSSDYAFQEQMLPILDSLGRANIVSLQEVALLSDRIAVHKNRPQLYGTQLDAAMVPFPILDSLHVDERRAAIGLMPLEQYIELTKAYYKQGKE